MEEADVVVAGGGGQVIDEGIGRLGRGVGGAGDDVAQAVEAGLAGAGAPQHALDLGVVIDKAQLHGGGAVVDQGDVVEVLADQLDHVLFLVGEVEVGVALIPVVALVQALVVGLGVADFGRGAVGQLVHIGGQVGAFAADAGDDDDGLVRVLLGAVQQLVGVQAGSRLGDGPVALPHADDGAVGLILGVEVDEVLVGVEPGVAQAVQQADHGEGVAQRTGTGAAVAGVGGRPAKDVDVVAGSQRQVGAVVFQQHDAFVGDVLAQLGGGVDGLIADGAAAGRQRDQGGHGAEADQVDHDAQRQQDGHAGLGTDHEFFRLALRFAGDHGDDGDDEHNAERSQIRRNGRQYVDDVIHVDSQHKCVFLLVFAVFCVRRTRCGRVARPCPLLPL